MKTPRREGNWSKSNSLIQKGRGTKQRVTRKPGKVEENYGCKKGNISKSKSKGAKARRENQRGKAKKRKIRLNLNFSEILRSTKRGKE